MGTSKNTASQTQPECSRDFDEWSAVFGGEIGRVDVGDRRAEGDAVADEIAHQAEDQRVDGLVRRIVAEPEADLFRPDGHAALVGDPGGLAAAGQAHQDDDSLLRQRCSALRR